MVLGQQTLWLSLRFRLQMIIDFENIHINMIKKRYLICEFSMSYWARASRFCCFQDLLCFYHLCYILWTYRLPSVPILIFVWLKTDLCHFFQITRNCRLDDSSKVERLYDVTELSFVHVAHERHLHSTYCITLFNRLAFLTSSKCLFQFVLVDSVPLLCVAHRHARDVYASVRGRTIRNEPLVI